MRSASALAASALAGLAAVVASLDGDTEIVPFFIGLTFLGGVEAWAIVAGRSSVARALALLWLLAAVWAGVLLLWYVIGGGDGPAPAPEATYLGLAAAVYHLIGLFGGAVFALSGAYAPGASPAETGS
jgi:hypothetical protein